MEKVFVTKNRSDLDKQWVTITDEDVEQNGRPMYLVNDTEWLYREDFQKKFEKSNQEKVIAYFNETGRFLKVLSFKNRQGREVEYKLEKRACTQDDGTVRISYIYGAFHMVFGLTVAQNIVFNTVDATLGTTLFRIWYVGMSEMTFPEQKEYYVE